MNYHNRPNVVGTFSDDQAIVKNASTDSTNMVEIGGPTGSKLMISIFANGAVNIVDTKVLSCTLQGFTADTASSATSFITSDNDGAATSDASGTTLANATVTNYLFSILGTTSDAAFADGDLIYEGAVPDTMLNLLSYDFIQLVYTSTATAANPGSVDAFVWAKP